MPRIKVAVVYGGRSSEHGISVVSAGSVIAALDPERYEVIPVGITTEGRWIVTDGDPAQMRITARTVPEVNFGSDVVLAPDPTSGGLVWHATQGGDGFAQDVDVTSVAPDVLRYADTNQFSGFQR